MDTWKIPQQTQDINIRAQIIKIVGKFEKQSSPDPSPTFYIQETAMFNLGQQESYIPEEGKNGLWKWLYQAQLRARLQKDETDGLHEVWHILRGYFHNW